MAFEVPNDYNYAQVVKEVRNDPDVMFAHGKSGKPTVLIRIDTKDNNVFPLFPEAA